MSEHTPTKIDLILEKILRAILFCLNLPGIIIFSLYRKLFDPPIPDKTKDPKKPIIILTILFWISMFGWLSYVSEATGVFLFFLGSFGLLAAVILLNQFNLNQLSKRQEFEELEQYIYIADIRTGFLNNLGASTNSRNINFKSAIEKAIRHGKSHIDKERDFGMLGRDFGMLELEKEAKKYKDETNHWRGK